MPSKIKSIVILPGLDGTGDLLDDFATELATDFDVAILSYRSTQTEYLDIFSYLKSQLPEHDCVVVGESFSGPLAGLCASDALPNVRGVVFAATFLTRPSIWPAWAMNLLWIAPFRNRLALRLIHPLFMGFKPGEKLFETFLGALTNVPKSTFLARLKSVHRLPRSNPPSLIKPSLFLRAKGEWFLSKRCGDQLAAMADKTVEVEAPHFLLQRQPKRAADEVRDFIRNL